VAVAFSLGRIHSEECVESLIQCLNDVNYTVQITAAESLGSFKSAAAVTALINKLRGSTGHLRKREKMGDPEQKRRLEVVYNYDRSGGKKGEGRALIPDKKAFDSLMNDANKVNHHLRRVCAESLGNMKNKKAVEPLIKALDDPINEVGEAAAWALGSIKDRRAVDPLMKKLAEGNSDIRQAATRTLGEINDPRSRDSLLKALKGKDKKVKAAAKQALEKLSYPKNEHSSVHNK
jgi:HEAT repeat protein